jgi:hypothetical protein
VVVLEVASYLELLAPVERPNDEQHEFIYVQNEKKRYHHTGLISVNNFFCQHVTPMG